jgi:hypothetical protein
MDQFDSSERANLNNWTRWVYYKVVVSSTETFVTFRDQYLSLDQLDPL